MKKIIFQSTMFLLPVSADLTGDSWLQTMLWWRQADRPYGGALLCTPPTFGLQPYKGFRTITKKIIVLLDHFFTNVFQER